jgi:hypothetical protein
MPPSSSSSHPLPNVFTAEGMSALLREEAYEWKRVHPVTRYAQGIEGERKRLMKEHAAVNQNGQPREGKRGAGQNPYLRPNELQHLPSAMRPVGMTPRLMSSFEPFTPTLLTQAHMEAAIHPTILHSSPSARELGFPETAGQGVAPHHLAPTTASLASARSLDFGIRHTVRNEGKRRGHFHLHSSETTAKTERGMMSEKSTTSLMSHASDSSRYRVSVYNNELGHFSSSAERLKIARRRAMEEEDPVYQRKVVELLLTEREKKSRREHLRRTEELALREQARWRRLQEQDAMKAKQQQAQRAHVQQVMQQQQQQQQYTSYEIHPSPPVDPSSHRSPIHRTSSYTYPQSPFLTPLSPAAFSSSSHFHTPVLQRQSQTYTQSPVTPQTMEPFSSRASPQHTVHHQTVHQIHSVHPHHHPSHNHHPPHSHTNVEAHHVKHTVKLPIAVENGHTTLLRDEEEEEEEKRGKEEQQHSSSPEASYTIGSSAAPAPGLTATASASAVPSPSPPRRSPNRFHPPPAATEQEGEEGEEGKTKVQEHVHSGHSHHHHHHHHSILPPPPPVDPSSLLSPVQSDQTNAILSYTQPWLQYDATHTQATVHEEAKQLLSHMQLTKGHAHVAGTKQQQQQQNGSANGQANGLQTNSPPLAPQRAPSSASTSSSPPHTAFDSSSSPVPSSSILGLKSSRVHKRSASTAVRPPVQKSVAQAQYPIVRTDSFSRASAAQLEQVQSTFAAAHDLLRSAMNDAKSGKKAKMLHAAPLDGRATGGGGVGIGLSPSRHARRPSSSLASSLVDDELINLVHESIADRLESNRLEVDPEYARKREMMMKKGPKRSDKPEHDMAHWALQVHHEQVELRKQQEQEAKERREAEQAKVAALGQRPIPPSPAAQTNAYAPVTPTEAAEQG